MVPFRLSEEVSEMGRIKEIERKASGRRKRKPVVCLICEGSGISKSSVAESVILILFQFLLNINLRISWYRRHRQPSGTAHITRMKVISFGASLTGMTTRTLCFPRQSKRQSRRVIRSLSPIRPLKSGSCCISIIRPHLLRIAKLPLSC